MPDTSPALQEALPLQADVTVKSNQPIWLTIFDQNGMFGAYIRDVVRCGLWALLTPPERAVLIALASWMRSDRRSNDGNPKVWPTNKLLIVLSGLKKSQLIEAKKRLIDRKLIAVIDIGGGNKSNSTEVEFLPLPDGQPVRNTGRVSNLTVQNGVQTRPESRTGTLPGFRAHPSGIPGASVYIKNKQTAATTTLPVVVPAAAAVELLKKEGFDADIAADLAAHGLELVKKAIARCNAAKKVRSRTGYIRRAIEEKYDGLQSAADLRRAQLPQAVQEDLAAERERRASQAAADERLISTLRALPAAHFKALQAEVLDDEAYTPAMREVWRKTKDPFKSLSLCAVIHQRLNPAKK